MFFFIGENEFFNADDSDTVGKHLYEFNIERDDYFYMMRLIWDEILVDVYEFSLDTKNTVMIPSGMYILIADEFGQVDWISVDEIVNRDIEVLVLSKNFSSWTLKSLKLKDMHENSTIFLPNTKNPMPISNENGQQILIVSKTDQFKNTVNKTVNNFIG